MDQVFFYKLDINFSTGRTQSDYVANIAKVDAIINALLDKGLEAVTNADKASYELDTGQTKTKVEYKSQAEIYEALDGWEKRRQYYVNKLTPRMMRLIPASNFKCR